MNIVDTVDQEILIEADINGVEDLRSWMLRLDDRLVSKRLQSLWLHAEAVRRSEQRDLKLAFQFLGIIQMPSKGTA
jgi:hypothetical protein